MTSRKWDQHFLDMALFHSRQSKDHSTRVGAVIVEPASKAVRSLGLNGFPRRMRDLEARLSDRTFKLDHIIHAEMNAIVLAAQAGVSLHGCTLYLAATDSTGRVWGGCPCIRCAVHVVQAGISRVVARPPSALWTKWADSIKAAEALFDEVGVPYIYMEPEEDS